MYPRQTPIWPTQAPQGPQVQQSSTYRADGLHERVTIPGLRAAIVAVPAGLLSGLLIGWTGLAWPVLYVMPTVTMIVFVFVFWAGSKRGQWLIERIVGADLDGDGYRGEPPAQPLPPVRVEVVQDGGQREDWIDLPYPEKLPELAEGLLSGRSYALNVWAGPGALYSRAEFEQLRDVLIKRGLARWKGKDPRNGWELTPAGRAVMRRLAHRPPSPTR